MEIILKLEICFLTLFVIKHYLKSTVYSALHHSRLEYYFCNNLLVVLCRIVIGEVPIEKVEDFCYLGSVMSSNSSCDKEIKTRMGKANAIFGRLEKIWKSNGCSVDTKVRLYESIVLSTLLYGAVTWPITVANGRRLEAAHHRWLRRILHVTWRDKITNKVIRERTRQEELGCTIRRKRLTWLGHVARLNMNRKAKQLSVELDSGAKKGKRKTEEKLAGDHPRGPENTGTDVG